MHCPYCGERIDDGLLDCPECGEELADSATVRSSKLPLCLLLTALMLLLGCVSFAALLNGVLAGLELSEESAVTSLREVAKAQRARADQANQDTAASLTLADLHAAGLIDAQLGSGTKSGYRFSLQGSAQEWRCIASPGASGRRHFSVGADEVVWVSNTRPAGVPSAPLPSESVPVASLSPPIVPAESVFRPGFVLSDCDNTIAGIAFVTRVEGYDTPVLLSALHLLGESGGLSRDLPPERVASELSRVDLCDVFSGEGITSVTSGGVGIPATAPLNTPSRNGDVVAFWAPPGLEAKPFVLSEALPPEGAEVWLVSEVQSGAPPGRLLHRALVDFYDPDERLLYYDFDDRIVLRATSGGALVDAAGRVVAIHLGGGTDSTSGKIYGVANPVRVFLAPLKSALGKHPRLPQPEPFKGRTLEQARQTFTSRLTCADPAPQEYDEETAPPEAEAIHYRSGDLDLMAWVSKDPGDGSKHPAVLFLHGGFSFAEQDWTDTKPLRDAGFVVMTPTLRGENGNPGSFECFYGELDDALAAGMHLAGLPYVNPEAVFVCGHSVGGTLATLVCMLPSSFRAGVSLSGAQDVPRWLASQLEIAPFDITDPRELALRNPRAFAASVRVPMRFYVETNGGRHQADVAEFVALAKAAGRDVELTEIVGADHWDMVRPSLESVAPWLRQQAGGD